MRKRQVFVQSRSECGDFLYELHRWFQPKQSGASLLLAVYAWKTTTSVRTRQLRRRCCDQTVVRKLDVQPRRVVEPGARLCGIRTWVRICRWRRVRVCRCVESRSMLPPKVERHHVARSRVWAAREEGPSQHSQDSRRRVGFQAS